MRRRFGATATTNIWFGIGAPAEPLRHSRAHAEPARADDLWQTTCFEAFLRVPGARGISRVEFRAVGRMGGLRLHRLSRTAGPTPRSRLPYIRVEDNLTWWALGATIAVDAERGVGAGPVRGPRGEGRHQILLGAGPSAGEQARLPRPRLLRRAPSLSSVAMTLFGIDRLLAEPELRRPLEGKRVALARASRVGHARPHAQPRRARRGRAQDDRGVRPAARPSRRQAGQYGGVRRLHRSGPRDPGVQPLRRGPPPDRPVDGHVRHDPDRPSGPRLPHLHLHHDAALRARSRGRARQERVGARPAQSRRAPGRGADAAPRLGKLRRRGADADAPRPDAGRARPTGSSTTSSSTSIIA